MPNANPITPETDEKLSLKYHQFIETLVDSREFTNNQDSEIGARALIKTLDFFNETLLGHNGIAGKHIDQAEKEFFNKQR